MSNYLGDILKTRGKSEPNEFIIIKKYVKDNFDENVRVSTFNGVLVIGVSNSALAGTLQLRINEIKDLLPPNSKVRVSIV